MVIDIEGKNYYLDLKKISEFVYYSNNHPIKESEIVDTYGSEDDSDKNDGEFGVSSKTIRETTSYGVAQIDNIRYDLLKSVILQVLGFGYGEEDKLETLPFGFEIAFNTLITEGFLKEIN